jgi:hypothetical protein
MMGRLCTFLLALGLALRVAAFVALPQPLQSDGLSYFTIAQHMAAGQWPTDAYGQHAFYSIGYPLVLTPFFAVFGASVKVAFGVNLALALVTGLLIAGLARSLSRAPLAPVLALAAYAVWLPGMWNATMLARENLSTPLLLAVMLLALKLRERPGLAAPTGAVWGFAVLAGSSALPLVLAPLVALVLAPRAALRLSLATLALAAGAALVLAPWGFATKAMLGAPTLSTNTGFNLYIGNNPAANGRFVSIADTPAGPQWHAMLAQRGEMGAMNALGQSAVAWALANPARTAQLGATKLALFWAPNMPNAQDFAASRLVSLIRLGEVAQYLLILTLAAAGLGAIRPGPRAILLVGAGGFWALHAAAYIIERYRDPVMPLLITLGAVGLARFLQTRPTPRETFHAA